MTPLELEVQRQELQNMDYTRCHAILDETNIPKATLLSERINEMIKRLDAAKGAVTKDWRAR